jgi:hypothetical protein
MAIDLNQCKNECHDCVVHYIEKHKLKSGEKFKLQCTGIPKEYIPEHILSALGVTERSALAMVDPVIWAAEILDWHCLDPEGKEWERKENEGSLGGLPAYNEERAKIGKSIFHRPYQKEMLQCSALRKIFRVGRQCLTAKASVQLSNNKTKSIKDIQYGDIVLSLNKDNKLISAKVIDQWIAGIKSVYKVRTKFGHEIECTSNHRFLINNQSIDTKNNYPFDINKAAWLSIDTGLAVGSKIAVRYTANALRWDYVSSVEYIGEQETYDIEIEDTHNFIANGLITHNSGKTETICIAIAFNIFTKENYHVEVIAPYQSQVDVIFKRLGELIDANSILKNSIARNVKAPQYTITLKNGSQVIGFTAGTKSGQDAGASRGQHANMLVFDEADMLSPKDIDAALAVIINHPEATVWMSSTPTGKREKFFESCHSPQYKEFHYPSQVNPNWTDEHEEYFRSELTEEGYRHEICLCKGTIVKTSNGDKPIEEVCMGDKVFDHQGNLINVVKGAVLTGVQQVCSASLGYGDFTITATPTHGFPNRQFKKTPFSELKELPVYPHRQYDYSHREIVMARVIGYNLGDGTVLSTRNQASFYSSKEPDMVQLLKDIKFLWPDHQGKVVNDIIRNKNKPNALVHVDGPRSTVNLSGEKVNELLYYGAIRGKKVKSSFRVPAFIREVREWLPYKEPAPIYTIGNQPYIPKQWAMDNLSFKIKVEFLAGLFGAEGSTPRTSVGKMPSTVSLSMCKRKDIDGSDFFNDLKDILQQLGIKSTWTMTTVGENDVYVLYVYNHLDNIKRFFQVVGYRYAEEKETLAFNWVCYLGEYKNTLLEKIQSFNTARSLRQQGKTFQEIIDHTRLTPSQVSKAIYRNDVPKRLKNKQFDSFDDWLKKHLIEGAIFLPYRKPLYYHKTLYETYNITVDSFDHSYLLANGIRTFNCAEFGSQEEGVYQVKYVEAAQTEFEYGQLTPNSSWCYCIGVDWNDVKIGTTIAVVGLNPQDNKFYLVDKSIVSRAERTQLVACQKVADLNRKWRPDFIYVDKGYGTVQVEVLHDFGARQLTALGHNHPDARLREIVKAYDFGSSIEVYDLFTKQPIKKPAKPFLIENSVRRFENYTFCYPASDKKFTDQLLGYVIDRVSDSGRPVYKQRNESAGDHLLDAVNLALVAFTLEKSKLGKPIYCQDIAFAPKFGENLQGLPLTEEAKNHKPLEGRANLMKKENETFPNENGDLPASKSVYDQETKIWAWPGWGHDAPRPVGRALADAISQARNRIFGSNRNRNRPHRNKF